MLLPTYTYTDTHTHTLLHLSSLFAHANSIFRTIYRSRHKLSFAVLVFHFSFVYISFGFRLFWYLSFFLSPTLTECWPIFPLLSTYCNVGYVRQRDQRLYSTSNSNCISFNKSHSSCFAFGTLLSWCPISKTAGPLWMSITLYVYLSFFTPFFFVLIFASILFVKAFRGSLVASNNNAQQCPRQLYVCQIYLIIVIVIWRPPQIHRNLRKKGKQKALHYLPHIERLLHFSFHRSTLPDLAYSLEPFP